MITDLTITGFRGFKNFTLHDLGRINLLVGANNSGKTSVLEALDFFAFQGDPMSLFNAMARRGESKRSESGPEIDICHLFYGHETEANSRFSISGKRINSTDTAQADILESAFDKDDEEFLSPYILKLTWNENDVQKAKLRLKPRGGLSYHNIRKYSQIASLKQPEKSFFVSTSFLPADQIVRLFEEVVLTPEEQLVIESIKHIDPTIERIASVGSEERYQRYPGTETRGGLVVKCKGVHQRIPIGSMGDGIWRMLGIALALVKAKEGILLIDEIDTGLHFSVMEDMWKLIAETARRLNVQVFAATHNSDCWTSLAAALCDEHRLNDKATIQRIEKDKNRAVAFTRDEIIIAAKRGIEVR